MLKQFGIFLLINGIYNFAVTEILLSSQQRIERAAEERKHGQNLMQ